MSKTKTITAKWTIDLNADIDYQVSKDATQSLSDDIDFEVMMELLLDSGWHKVVLKPMTWEDGYTVDTWVETNVKCKFHTRGLVWIFEDAKDANWFSVRWL